MSWKTGGKIAKTLIGVLLSVALLKGFVATSYLIPSTGMENSLFRGERILVNKWSYGLRLPFMRWLNYHRWRERPVEKEDIIVFNNPANLKESHIDQREIFINRCIGTPGDTLLIDSLYAVVSVPQNAPDQKFFYAYSKDHESILDSLLQTLAIRPGTLSGKDSLHNIRSFSRYEHYLITQALNDNQFFTQLGREDSGRVLKPLIIPGKGITIQIHPWNQTLLRNTLVLHEGKQAEIKNDTLYIDGQPTTQYQFTQDYYWVISNNPTNPSDSRLFGLVPHSHIIGKASRIWLSMHMERIGKRIQ